MAKKPFAARQAIEKQMSEPTNRSWTGGCQCGAVRYRLLAPPNHASICHCRMCQKASGGPIMAFARVKKAQLR
jgi:hypothetical protein